MAEQITSLDPSNIHIHPSAPNIRSKILKAEIKELIDSIREKGVRTPIRVFKLDGDSKYYLVSGERRLRSFEFLKEEDPKEFSKIPVIISEYKGTPEEVIQEALYDNTIENIQRKDLNGLDLANRLKMFIDADLTKQEIALKIGKSITWVTETLKFLDADDIVKEKVEAGEISLDEGKKIAKLPESKQGAVAKGLAKAKEIGDKESKKAIKNAIEKTNRVRSNPMPQKKEIKRKYNMLSLVVEAMKKDETVNDTKQYQGLLGTKLALKWVLGEEPDMKVERLLEKYKIEVTADGTRLTPEMVTKLKKQKEKKTAKAAESKTTKKKTTKKKTAKK